MRKKLLLMLVVVLLLIITTVTTSLASGEKINHDKTMRITFGGKMYTAVISDDDTPYGDPAVDPVPHPEGIMPKAPRVTASDVWRLQLGPDPEYPYEYVATGYVTMMDGSSEVYHYTRAELWWNGSLNVTSGNVWGYGKVSATSWPTGLKATARIFYGM